MINIDQKYICDKTSVFTTQIESIATRERLREKTKKKKKYIKKKGRNISSTKFLSSACPAHFQSRNICA